MFSARWRWGSFNNKWWRLCEEMVFFGVYMWPFGSHFWGRVPDISHKDKDAREKSIFHGVCVGILGHWWGPWWSGKVDMPIPVRYEIGWSQKVVSGVIFWVEYLISTLVEKGPTTIQAWLSNQFRLIQNSFKCIFMLSSMNNKVILKATLMCRGPGIF